MDTWMTKPFKNRMIFIGFGSIGQALIPLLFRHFKLQSSQVIIFANNSAGLSIAEDFGAQFNLHTINAQNYSALLTPYVNEGDFLINLSVDVSSTDLIQFCDKRGALYIDTSTETWEEQFLQHTMQPQDRTNYMLRESLLAAQPRPRKTCIVTHGANPGLISHLLKQALINLAKEVGLSISSPKSAQDWASLAYKLEIKAIHIAEHDTQISSIVRKPSEFTNTWSIPGLIHESMQPAELGWGTHEKHWPYDACRHAVGSQCSVFLAKPGASVRVRSWTPTFGEIHGFLITHAESTTIPNFLTLREGDRVIYRPTTHYAYCPCPDAVISLMELHAREWTWPQSERLMMSDITQGVDELGILLMGNPKGAYWFGSTLSIEEARRLVPYNNATSLQVAASVLAAMMWAIDHPNEGLVEPEFIDHEYVMQVAGPYLGKVAGYMTSWTPLVNREFLFQENIDRSDPWQFLNVRV